jgi:hypothetical protein
LIPEESTSETQTKRQATQHGCLPSLLGDGDKGIEKYRVRKKYFVQLEQPRLKKISCTGRTSQTRKDPFLFALFEPPFTSVSTVARATPLWSTSISHPLK